jgi:ferredoxin-NADP reductase
MAYPAKLLKRNEAAQGIWTYRLERPEGFSFRAGQWCFLNLPDLGSGDERGLRRHLSIASSPGETGLLFGTKDSESAFKRTLREMPIGTRIDLEEPRGTLSLPEGTDRPVALLAGGIGITPFRSMIRHALDAKTGHRLTAFYSNRTPEEALFLDELQAWETPGTFALVASMTRMQLSSRTWDGPTGRLSPDLIRQKMPDWEEATYFLSGPPPMVDAMAAVLDEMGVDPARIRPEKFSGYGSE